MHASEMVISLAIGLPKAVLVSSGLVLVTVILDYARMLRLRQNLPPGPFPPPIVGNHFQTPSVRPRIEWEKWTEDYQSPMIAL
jgi:hypothetical protein